MAHKNRTFITFLLLNHLFPFLDSSSNRMNKEKIRLIQNIMRWQKDLVNQCQDGFILNFGYKNALPLPEIRISTDSDFLLNIGSFGIKSPSKCSIVVIGGKYLDQVDEVMRMEDIAWMPSAVFLMAEKPGQDIKFTMSTRHRRSPTMYQVPATRSSVVQFVMT